LRSSRTLGRIFRKIVELGVAKQIVRTSIRLWKMTDWTLWKAWPPPKTKEETAHRVGAINVGALTTVGTFGRTNQRKMMVVHLDWLASYQGAA
jgi:hypothetical protein